MCRPLSFLFWGFAGLALVLAPLSRGETLALQVFSNAVLVADHPANDGDSFIVSAGGVRHHLRLYYADCPESRATQDADYKRVRDQRRYFGLTNEQAVIEYGRAASAFTRAALAKPFTVFTAFAGALGRSDDKRYYAFIRSADGADLAEGLVRQGLARAYGTGRETPEKVPQQDYKAWLSDLEVSAMLKRRGIWADADQDQIVALRAETRKEERELTSIRTALKTADDETLRVRLNSATIEELDRLPGVGEATARKIVAGRPWKSWKALEKVVGPAMIENWGGHAVLE